MSCITVWMEIDASRRALRELRGIRAPGLDHRGARNVLIACGATYVADTLVDFAWVGRRLRRDADGQEPAEHTSRDDDLGIPLDGSFD